MSSRYSVTFHSGLRPNITRRVDLDAADLRFNYPLVLFEASSEDVDWYLTLPPDLHEAKFVSWETMRDFLLAFGDKPGDREIVCTVHIRPRSLNWQSSDQATNEQSTLSSTVEQHPQKSSGTPSSPGTPGCCTQRPVGHPEPLSPVNEKKAKSKCSGADEGHKTQPAEDTAAAVFRSEGGQQQEIALPYKAHRPLSYLPEPVRSYGPWASRTLPQKANQEDRRPYSSLFDLANKDLPAGASTGNQEERLSYSPLFDFSNKDSYSRASASAEKPLPRAPETRDMDTLRDLLREMRVVIATAGVDSQLATLQSGGFEAEQAVHVDKPSPLNINSCADSLIEQQKPEELSASAGKGVDTSNKHVIVLYLGHDGRRSGPIFQHVVHSLPTLDWLEGLATTITDVEVLPTEKVRFFVMTDAGDVEYSVWREARISSGNDGTAGDYVRIRLDIVEKDTVKPNIKTAEPDIVNASGSYGLKAADIDTSACPTPIILPATPGNVTPSITSEVALTPNSIRYLATLSEAEGNTSASTRLLRIIKDEDVGLDTSLGLKLLDLAKALRVDGELAPVQIPRDQTAVQQAQVDHPEPTEGMLREILEKLNDHSGMLNAIAEASGVTLLEDEDEVKSCPAPLEAIGTSGTEGNPIDPTVDDEEEGDERLPQQARDGTTEKTHTASTPPVTRPDTPVILPDTPVAPTAQTSATPAQPPSLSAMLEQSRLRLARFLQDRPAREARFRRGLHAEHTTSPQPGYMSGYSPTAFPFSVGDFSAIGNPYQPVPPPMFQAYGYPREHGPHLHSHERSGMYGASSASAPPHPAYPSPHALGPHDPFNHHHALHPHRSHAFPHHHHHPYM